MGMMHPDNRVRKQCFIATGVAVGVDSVINPNFRVSDSYLGLVTIGDRVAISPNVTVLAESSPNNSLLKNHPYVKEKLIRREPVTIQDDAWIGANATILPGVTRGRCHARR
jgi:acetyltransferase-like isoleucine patch superfamily enzyme